MPNNDQQIYIYMFIGLCTKAKMLQQRDILKSKQDQYSQASTKIKSQATTQNPQSNPLGSLSDGEKCIFCGPVKYFLDWLHMGIMEKISCIATLIYLMINNYPFCNLVPHPALVGASFTAANDYEVLESGSCSSTANSEQCSSQWLTECKYISSTFTIFGTSFS